MLYLSTDSEFDTAKAEKKLLKNVQWRKENKIDSILEEDWKYYDEEYRYFVEGCDKEGKRGIVSDTADRHA